MSHKKKKPELTMYVIRKYVMAATAGDALKRERKVQPHDVFIDDDWRKNKTDRLADAIGFQLDPD